MRGLDKDYHTKVKTHNPHTLEDAIKGAQIYDDLSDKKGFVKNTTGAVKSRLSSLQVINMVRGSFLQVQVSRQSDLRSPRDHSRRLRNLHVRREKSCVFSVYLINTPSKNVHSYNEKTRT